MKYLPLLLFLLSCDGFHTPVVTHNDSISIAELRTQLEQNRAELLKVRANTDSALRVVELMDNNLSVLERRMTFLEKDTVYQFIGNDNLFIRADELIGRDTLTIWTSDSVQVKIWVDGQQIIRL